MPKKAYQRPCNKPGCPEYQKPGRRYCTNHLSEYETAHVVPEYKQWYKTAAWQKLRAHHLRANPYCVQCMELGITESEHLAVDHITEHKGNLKLFWDPDNLQTLCRFHNSQKAGRSKGRK